MTLEIEGVIMRLGAATAAGMVLGLNRDMHEKPIGMRTLGLVSARGGDSHCRNDPLSELDPRIRTR